MVTWVRLIRNAIRRCIRHNPTWRHTISWLPIARLAVAVSSLAQSVGLAFAKVGVTLPLPDLRLMLAVPHLRYAVAVVLLFVEQQRHDAYDDGGCDDSADEDGAIGRVHTNNL